MPANFSLLLRKTLIQELRSWKWTLIEILVVTMIFTIVVVDPVKRSKDYLLKQENKRMSFVYNRSTLYNLDSFRHFKSIKAPLKRFSVLYTPYSEFTATVMNAVRKNLALRSVKPVDNQHTINNLLNKNTILAGVIFHYNVTVETIPDKLSVTLRFPYNFRTIKTDVPDDELWITRCSGISITDTANDPTREDLYVTEGFLPLQHQIFEMWLRLLRRRDGSSENDIIPHININYMYLPNQAENCFFEDTSNITWFLYHFTFFITFLNMIWRYGREREANIQEHHWLYGYQAGTQWLAHVIISFLHILFLNLIIIISVCILYALQFNMEKLPNGKLFIFFLFLSLYSIMLILFAIILAIIFHNAANAVLCGVTIWLASYALFSLISDYANIHQIATIILPNVFFNNFLPLGIQMIINPDNHWKDYRIMILLLNQIIHIFMLLLIAIFMNYLLPGYYMQRTSIYAALVCGRSKLKPNLRKVVVTLDRRIPAWNRFEYGPLPGEEKLYVKNVVTFHPKNPLQQKLKNITMRFFKGEISVILGGYDIGKTMLITCICGWSKPVVGHIYFDGIKDIYQNWSEYSTMIDVCMENNALFDELSVYETLNYFAAVKQKTRDLQQIDLETSKWLIILNNANIKSSDKIKDLTFSQQRLIALCCSLTCNTTIILLNEPTQHMTYSDQLLFWRILKQEKIDRTIIMTTASIDEAEAIGDRVGILNEGSLVAYGSQFFLKTNFGVGFNLIILKDPLISSNPITNVIRQYMPNLTPDNQIGDEILYKLPAEGRHFFQQLLLELEENAEHLGITSIRMVGSELSEVYMTLGLDNSLKQSVPEITQTLKFIHETPNELKRQHCYAMLYKKMIHQAPNILPVALIFVVIFLILIINHITSVINVFKEPPNKIIVGYQDTQPLAPRIPDSLQNCSYWELKIKKDRTNKWINRNVNLFIFNYNDIICGSFNTSYEKNVNELKTYELLGAVEIHKPRQNISIWINSKIFHTAPLILNMAHNYIIRDIFPNEINRSTTLINFPEETPTHIKLNLLHNRVIYVRIPLSIGIIMPITTSCFVITIVEERHSNLLTLQRIAGVNMYILWMVSIMWDLCTFFAFSVVYTLIMSLTTISTLGFAEQLMALLLLNIYGLGALSIIYLMARFMGPSKAQAFLLTLIWQLATGLCAYVFYWDVLKSEGVYYYIFLLSPIFALLDCFSRLHMSSIEQEYCAEVCLTYKGCDFYNICELIPHCCFNRHFAWQRPGILGPLIFMLASTALNFIIFYLAHIHQREQIYSLSPTKRVKRLGTLIHSYDDEDVVDERIRIANLTKISCKTYNVLADQLEYYIPHRSQRLNTISFALDKYMCMGVYGSHHAGKSHLIRQLVSEEKILFGELYIDAKDIKHETASAMKSIGYCSQNYDLCEIFTPRQLFTLMFLIKGVPIDRISEKLREISASLELRSSMGKRIGHLAIPIQRKVCVAIALIAYNKVLVLDEPTYGLPAKERRLIWNVLRYARYCGKTVIVSSNDSLECETLADYIIIVHRGDLLAMGSPQYLRQKFTRGFYLYIKLITDGKTAEEAEQNLERDVQNLIRFASFLHDESQLIYRCGNHLSFYIPVEDIVFSYLYGSIEKNRRRLNISNYTIGQGTLLNALENILQNRSLRKPFLRRRHQPNELLHMLH